MTNPSVANDSSLRDCELVIEDPPELQWRQVHPQWVDHGLVASDAFAGVEGSRATISTVRSMACSAAQAHRFYVESLGLLSAGTWAVTVSEVVEVLGRVVDDAACDDVDTPGHSFIDLRGLTRAQRRVARATLAARATSRGRQFPPRE